MRYRHVVATLACFITLPLFGQTFTTLHNFTDQSMTDPNEPNSTLVEVSPGVFYGTTQVGGVNEVGTLFSITSAGVYTHVHDFTKAEACYPQGKLIQSVDGFLYGISTGSLFNGDCPSTLFRSA